MNRNDKNPHLCEEATLREAIAVLELGSVARGMEVADAILWEADIDLLVLQIDTGVDSLTILGRNAKARTTKPSQPH